MRCRSPGVSSPSFFAPHPSPGVQPARSEPRPRRRAVGASALSRGRLEFRTRLLRPGQAATSTRRSRTCPTSLPLLSCQSTATPVHNPCRVRILFLRLFAQSSARQEPIRSPETLGMLQRVERQKQHGHYCSENTSNLMNLASGSLFLWERLYQVSPHSPHPSPGVQPARSERRSSALGGGAVSVIADDVSVYVAHVDTALIGLVALDIAYDVYLPAGRHVLNV